MLVLVLGFVLTLVVGVVLARLRKPEAKAARFVGKFILVLLTAVVGFLAAGSLTYATLGSTTGAAAPAATAAFLAAAAAGFVAFQQLRRLGSKGLLGAGDGAERKAVTVPSGRAESPGSDVFISYKRDERPEVAAIAQRLSALKLNVWFDAEMRSGTTFDAEIDRQVRAAKCVLVCWSPGAVASDWVRGEATIGRSRGVLCAAMLKPCDLPAPFNLVHTNDLIAGIGPPNPEWLAMLESIGALIGRMGLADYERLESVRDAAAYGAWLSRHPNDPLAEAVIARLKALSA